MFRYEKRLEYRGAEREIRTPVSEGQWISSPPQYQAMRSPPNFSCGHFFQESILAYSSRLAAIIARPRPTLAVTNVNPGRPPGRTLLSLGLLVVPAALLTSSTNKSTFQS